MISGIDALLLIAIGVCLLPFHTLFVRLGISLPLSALGYVLATNFMFFALLEDMTLLSFLDICSVLMIDTAAFLGIVQVHSFILRAFTLNVLKTIHENDNLLDLSQLMMAYGDGVGYQTLFVKRIEGLVQLGLLKSSKSEQGSIELTTFGRITASFIKISYRVLGIKNAGQ
jgi:hypothetical protein